MKLLHIDSSILGSNSASRTLTAALVEKWRQREPGLEVTYLDLAQNPLSYLTGPRFAARSAAAEGVEHEPTAEEAAVDQFLEADVVVVGAPMYNFSIPAQLKTWIDHVAFAGKTFSYTSEGPKGLAIGKKVIIVSSRGGVYSSGAYEAYDFQEKYLRAIFGFLGVTDVEFVRAEGLARGAEARQAALDGANQAILAA